MSSKVIDRPQIFGFRLLIDYSLIIANNQWLINGLLIDYWLITRDVSDHRLVMSGKCQNLAQFLGVLYEQRYFCKRHFLVIDFFHAQSYTMCDR